MLKKGSVICPKLDNYVILTSSLFCKSLHDTVSHIHIKFTFEKKLICYFILFSLLSKFSNFVGILVVLPGLSHEVTSARLPAN